MLKIFNLLYKTLYGLLLATIVVIAVSLLPLPNNYRIYSVVSGSMEPTLPVGSVVISKPQSDYQTGDVVTLRTDDPKVTVTHRLFSKNETDGKIVYETKGDANQTKDPNTYSPESIIGKVLFHIPLLGYPISFSKSLEGLIILIIIPTTIIIYSEILVIKNEVVRLIKQKRGEK